MFCPKSTIDRKRRLTEKVHFPKNLISRIFVFFRTKRIIIQKQERSLLMLSIISFLIWFKRSKITVKSVEIYLKSYWTVSLSKIWISKKFNIPKSWLTGKSRLTKKFDFQKFRFSKYTIVKVRKKSFSSLFFIIWYKAIQNYRQVSKSLSKAKLINLFPIWVSKLIYSYFQIWPRCGDMK